MPKRTLLQRRKNGVYYIRKRVPKRLIPIIGKAEIVKSLGTSNYEEALLLTNVDIDPWIFGVGVAYRF